MSAIALRIVARCGRGSGVRRSVGRRVGAFVTHGERGISRGRWRARARFAKARARRRTWSPDRARGARGRPPRPSPRGPRPRRSGARPGNAAGTSPARGGSMSARGALAGTARKKRTRRGFGDWTTTRTRVWAVTARALGNYALLHAPASVSLGAASAAAPLRAVPALRWRVAPPWRTTRCARRTSATAARRRLCCTTPGAAGTRAGISRAPCRCLKMQRMTDDPTAGLGFLSGIDGLFIQERVEFFEAITGCDTNNRYHLAHPRGGSAGPGCPRLDPLLPDAGQLLPAAQGGGGGRLRRARVLPAVPARSRWTSRTARAPHSSPPGDPTGARSNTPCFLCQPQELRSD